MKPNENILSEAIMKRKKKEKIKIDSKEYDLSDFDDTRSWSKPRKK